MSFQEWLKALMEWENSEDDPETHSVSISAIRNGDRFRDGDRVYVARGNPFEIGGFVYISIWERGMERGKKKEVRVPRNTKVEIVFKKSPPPFPEWWIRGRGNGSGNRI